jgi:hypothetical protein
MLKHYAEMPPNRLRLTRQIILEVVYFPLGERHERTQDAKQRSFTTAVGAEEPKDLPTLDLQRNPG